MHGMTRTRTFGKRTLIPAILHQANSPTNREVSSHVSRTLEILFLLLPNKDSYQSTQPAAFYVDPHDQAVYAKHGGPEPRGYPSNGRKTPPPFQEGYDFEDDFQND